MATRQRSQAVPTPAARRLSQWLGTLLPGEQTAARQWKFVLVNTCTVVTLLVGSGATLLAASDELSWAAACLLLCFAVDGLDGALARRFGVTSPFGAQMDSLADLCAFGVATPVLAYHWLGGVAPRYLTVAVCGLLAASVMVRLARFTVRPKDAGYFSGLPAAMPAMILAVAIHLGVEPARGYLGVVAGLAVLMVTAFPYAKIVRLRAVPWWAWLVPAAAAPFSPQATFGLLVAAYLTSGPARWALGRRGSAAPHSPAPRPAAADKPPDPPHVRVTVVGAGFAGLGMAIRLRQLGVDELVVLERADDLGGTWRDNTYPGAACDVPANLYSYSFAPDPDWSHTFPTQPEIQRYLRRCAARYGVQRHLRFGHEMLVAEWDEAAARWRVDTTAGPLTTDVLVVATGPLSQPAVPQVPGLELFSGTTVHSAAWDPAHDLTGKRVAVIGTGASAIQFIPHIQPLAAQCYVFQRTPAWVIPRWDRAKTGLEKALLRRLPRLQRVARTVVYLWRESLILGLTVDQHLLKPVEWLARRHLRRQVDDPALRAALTPDYTLGCKRLILSNDYFPAITRDNVELVTSGITEVRPNSIVTADRTERAVDVIVLGTGFEAAHSPVAGRLRGRHGRLLADVWREQGPEAYLGTAMAGYPNLFMILGPNTISGQNSSLLTMEAQISYVADAVRFMDKAGVTAVEVRPEAQASFVADVQRRMAGTVWLSGCRSWYLDDRGRNTTLWPGFTRSFRQRTGRFDRESYVLRVRSAERP